MLLTPQLAQRWLDRELSLGHIHVIDTAKVEAFSRALLADEFRPGSPILYGPIDGVIGLLDGRHRLRAMVAADVGLRVTVAVQPC